VDGFIYIRQKKPRNGLRKQSLADSPKSSFVRLARASPPSAILASDLSAVVLADARAAAWLTLASAADVLADARAAALHALAFLAVVLCWRLLLTRWMDGIFIWRLCSQMLEPPHGLHKSLLRLCSQMLESPHCLHLLFWWLCSQMLDPPHCLHLLLLRLCS